MSDSSTPADPSTREIVDDFRGDNAHLRESIKALINLNDADSLTPHGIGGHARSLLAACYHRLSAERSDCAPVSSAPHERMSADLRVQYLAELMYTTYCESVGGVAHDGQPLPTWSVFAADPARSKQAEAWRKAALACFLPNTTVAKRILAHKFVTALDELLRESPAELQQLLEMGVAATEAMIAHPHVACQENEETGVCTLRGLGLISGLVSFTTGYRIAARYSDADKLEGFTFYAPPLPTS